MEMQIQGCFRYLGNVYINPKCSLFVNGKTFTEKGNFDSSTTGYYPYVVFEVLYDKQNKSLTCKWGDDNSWDWILTALDFEYEPCYLEISGICCKMKYTSGYSTYNYGVSYTINCDLENSQNIIGYKS